MTPQLFTVREIAAKIADLDGSPIDPIFNKVRGAKERGLLEHYDTGGPKRGFRLTKRELYVAAVMVDVLDVGLSGEPLADAFRAVRAGRHNLGEVPSAFHGEPWNGLESTARSLVSGDGWALKFKVVRKADYSEYLTGGFVWDGEKPAGDKVAGIVASYRELQGERVIAELSFPSTVARLAELARQVEG